MSISSLELFLIQFVANNLINITCFCIYWIITEETCWTVIVLWTMISSSLFQDGSDPMAKNQIVSWPLSLSFGEKFIEWESPSITFNWNYGSFSLFHPRISLVTRLDRLLYVLSNSFRWIEEIKRDENGEKWRTSTIIIITAIS